MATEQFIYAKLGIGTFYTNTLQPNQFIRLTGNTTNSSNSITNAANVSGYFGLDELKIGMELISSNAFSSKVTITNIVGTTITVSGNASSSQTGELLRVDPGPGQAFIESGSLTLASGITDVNASNITGSTDAQYQAGDEEWAIQIPVAKDGSTSTQRQGQFAQFQVIDVQSRPAGATGNQVNLFISSSGGDINGFTSGMNWYDVTAEAGIYQVGPNHRAGTIYEGTTVGLTKEWGFGPGQIYDSNLIDALTSGSGGGAAFPYTGSAGISGSIDMTGSAKILLNSNENFLISNAQATSQSLFNINNEGVATFRVQPDGSAPTAVEGGLYFTTASAYIGIK